MWATFSQDFLELTESLRSESAGIMGYLEHVASNVVGGGGSGPFCAGDEALEEIVRDMPIPNSLLRRLQGSEVTYTTPITAEEEEAFASWARSNPLSSANALRCQPEESADTVASDSEDYASTEASEQPPLRVSTPNHRSVDSPNELAHKARKKLLCQNKLVLERYLSLVGDTVSSGTNASRSPATSQRWRQSTQAASGLNLGAGETKAAVTVAAADERSSCSYHSGMQGIAPGCITQDEFFDRYFFRLMQLRLSHAQRRFESVKNSSPGRTCESSPSSSSSSLSSSHSAVSPSHALPMRDERGANNDSSDFGPVPLFARRVITAASGFVAEIDNALNNVVVGDVSRLSSADGEVTDELGVDATNVEPTGLVNFRSPRRQIADLELVVQELQEALRQERRRVAQLLRVLEENGIEAPAELTMPPPLPAAEPSAKGSAVDSSTVMTPVRHIDASPASPASPASLADAAAATSSARDGRTPTSFTDTTLTPPPSNPKPNQTLSFAHSNSGEVLSAVTEDEDTWVNINSGCE